MAASTRQAVLSLYKQLLRESRKVTDYNFRLYAIRRTQDGFREHQNVSDAAKIQALLQKGRSDLETLKRQAIVSQLFGTGKLIIES